MQPKKERGGQPRNTNAVTHGARRMLPLAKFHAAAKPDEGKLWTFRKMLRTALAETHGDDLGFYREALVQSAVRHESRAILAGRWLRLHGEELPMNERLQLLATISSATDSRDKCLKALALDHDPRCVTADVWSTLATSSPTPAPISQKE